MSASSSNSTKAASERLKVLEQQLKPSGRVQARVEGVAHLSMLAPRLQKTLARCLPPASRACWLLDACLPAVGAALFGAPLVGATWACMCMLTAHESRALGFSLNAQSSLHHLLNPAPAADQACQLVLGRQATAAVLGQDPTFPQATTAASFPPPVSDALDLDALLT